jgi:hypothetical protein
VPRVSSSSARRVVDLVPVHSILVPSDVRARESKLVSTNYKTNNRTYFFKMNSADLLLAAKDAFKSEAKLKELQDKIDWNAVAAKERDEKIKYFQVGEFGNTYIFIDLQQKACEIFKQHFFVRS